MIIVVGLYLESTRTATVCLAAFHPEAFLKCEKTTTALITKFLQKTLTFLRYSDIEIEKDYCIHMGVGSFYIQRVVFVS